MRKTVFALALILVSCATPPPGEIPPGFIISPWTGRVISEAQGCALARAFEISVTVGAGALTGPALVAALRPYLHILNAPYCPSGVRLPEMVFDPEEATALDLAIKEARSKP